MSKPFPLQTLLDLAQADSNSAAARLGAINGHERNMDQRLQMLIEYRGEYAERLTRVAQTGTHGSDWRNFREFIDKIDAAIELQRELVARAKHEVRSGQLHWHAQQRKLKSFDALSARHYSAERKSEARQEQRDQDEFALRGFFGQRMMIG